MRILVAEDDATTRRLIEGLLRSAGHEVAVVSDGAQAWRALQEGCFEFVLLDWMMPEMEGVEVCRKIREDAALRTTYVILITAKDQPQDQVAGVDVGADDYLVKPLSSMDLRVALNLGAGVITRRRGGRPCDRPI